MSRSLFVTTALPYANGPFHIGHMMEYIQADIWVRFMRLNGHAVHFVCADDAHGAPIMLQAEKENITPQQLVARIAAERPECLNGFNISFNHWHSTDSAENVELSQAIYRKLRDQDLIGTRTIEQFFDPVKGMFLADRYIRGECPNCHSKNQNGDNCEVCGTVYAPTDLIDPVSALTGATPVLRSSEHYFFKLSDPRCLTFLRDWTTAGHLQDEVRNKAKEWLVDDENGVSKLTDWDISRDAPYFGIAIPDTKDKYFYVWLDAPVGYLASLKAYFDRGLANKATGTTQSFEQFMSDPTTEQVHFIGKDIIYFHTLFWPAMLHFSGRKVPNMVAVHGFLTVSGDKMSKSRGTGISPVRYLREGLNPEWLRYYLATKLTSRVEDLDFNPDDFVARVNSDLVGKYVNIASRSATFLARHFDGALSDVADDPQWLALDVAGVAAGVRADLEARDDARALRSAMAFADALNQLFDASKPWELAKDDAHHAELQRVCSLSITGFAHLTLWLKPILPQLAEKAESFLNCGPLSWIDAISVKKIGTYQHLMTRVDIKSLERLLSPPEDAKASNPAKSQASATKAADSTKAKSASGTPATQGLDDGMVGIDDFAKLELRVARIVSAEAVEGSDKLLRLMIDAGEGRERQVFSGIKAAYQPEQLVGKLAVLVANLKPRKMKFGISEGMVLASSSRVEGQPERLYLLEPNADATPGMRIS
jgi:methionyl-tRNA synthetase